MSPKTFKQTQFSKSVEVPEPEPEPEPAVGGDVGSAELMMPEPEPAVGGDVGSAESMMPELYVGNDVGSCDWIAEPVSSHKLPMQPESCPPHNHCPPHIPLGFIQLVSFAQWPVNTSSPPVVVCREQ